MVETIANLLNVPFIVYDANMLTAKGYSGDDVDDILTDLITKVEYDIKQAEKGIIYIDEIDKLAKRDNSTSDFNNRSVQQNFLRIVEGGVVSIGKVRGGNSREYIQLDTSKILFIGSGAFSGIEEIIDEKLGKKSNIGFGSDIESLIENQNKNITLVDNSDLIKYGMIPEFIARFPVKAVLNPLDANMLKDIITKPENSILEEYRLLFSIQGVALEIEEQVYDIIIERCLKENTGARALRAIFEEIFEDVLFKINSNKNIVKVNIVLNKFKEIKVNYLEESQKENLIVLEKQLKLYADQISKLDDNGYTSLCIAVENENLELVKLLLELGADVNQGISNGYTPLHIAASNGYIEIAEFLVRNRANVNKSENKGFTPIFLAIKHKHSKMVRLLIENGADINKQAECGWSPFHAIAGAGVYDSEILEIFLKNKGDINCRNKEGYSPIHLAIARGDIELINILLEKGGDIDQKLNDGRTLLHYAVEREELEVARFLLEKGIDINASDANGWTALYIAVKNEYKEIIELLLEKGANIEKIDSTGCSIFDYIDVRDDREIIQYFIIKFNIAFSKEKIIGRIILDKNKVTNKAIIKFEYLEKKEFEKIIFVLRNKGYDIGKGRYNLQRYFRLAIEKDDLEAIKLMIKIGASVKKVYDYGWTALNIAISHNRLEIAKVLVENGAVINTETKNMTPLQFAAQEGHLKIVKYLVAKGANINFANYENCTALYFAARGNKVKIAEYLIKKGADVNIKSKEGKTILSIAVVREHLEMVKLLIDSRANINDIIINNKTVLDLALEGKCHKIIDYLRQKNSTSLKYKANLN